MNRDDYEREICFMSTTASRVPFIPDVVLDDWTPKVAECHANVDYWVKHNPTHAAVRGWLEYASFGGDHRGFTAHSVVRGFDGQLFDITPTHDRNVGRGRFVIHPGDEKSFHFMRRLNINLECMGNCPAIKVDLGAMLLPMREDGDEL